jgi:hypothetical protein
MYDLSLMIDTVVECNSNDCIYDNIKVWNIVLVDVAILSSSILVRVLAVYNICSANFILYITLFLYMLKGTTCTYYIMYVHVCMYVLTTRNNHNYLHTALYYVYSCIIIMATKWWKKTQKKQRKSLKLCSGSNKWNHWFRSFVRSICVPCFSGARPGEARRRFGS